MPALSVRGRHAAGDLGSVPAYATLRSSSAPSKLASGGIRSARSRNNLACLIVRSGIACEPTISGAGKAGTRPLRSGFWNPPGLACLHQLLVALHLVFVQANDCGLRNVGWFLRLAGLDEFLPSSYGAQQAFARHMETLLADFGREEDQRLASQMPPREISLCEDEAFHPQICSVAIEPVSNFLLLE